MKLAEALSIRKDLEMQISKLKKLLESTVKVQEGDVPTEEPEVLMKELDNHLKHLEHYIYRINMTNMSIKDESGKTMTKLLAERDVLRKRIDVLQNTFNQVSELTNRYGRNEIKNVITIDAKSLRTELNQCSQQYRELDMRIQTLNFTHELVE